MRGENMNTSITNEKKKDFLKWFTKNHTLNRRESLWILDYLYNHDIMLEKTHFIESADQSPRGIYMSAKDNHHPTFRFYKNGHTFKDAMQAFHEIRLNWSSQLYLEIDFENAWQTPEYLAVLEDNPYARWNDNIPKELMEQMDEALTYETLLFARHELLDKIDESLIEGQKESFTDLTKILKEIERKIDQSIV